MPLGQLLKYASRLTPGSAMAGASRLGKRRLAGWAAQLRGRTRETFTPRPSVPGGLATLVHRFGLEAVSGQVAPLGEMTANYLDHRFDLLGSGWVRITYGLECAGVLGHAYPAADPACDPVSLVDRLSQGNRSRAARIRALIAEPYVPIDWQLDFKSGYRWSEHLPSQLASYGHLPGVDIKVPWELARLQHLPRLALMSVAGTQAGESSAPLRHEYRNQALDFMAANPPGYGVNWSCAMDVAIRAANLVLAHSLFRHFGGPFDEPFEAELEAALVAHGRHIVEHLEWNDGARNNHFLADICGLAFIAAALPPNAETDGWLAFAVRRLIEETAVQFHADGGNFEASTSYHRLSADMVIYTTALILGLDAAGRARLAGYTADQWSGACALEPAPLPCSEELGPFPAEHFARIARMAQFSRDVTKPDGRAVQIGDTDNGRFFTLSPAIFPGEHTESPLDHRPMIAAAGSLLGRDDLIGFAGTAFGAEHAVVTALAKSKSPAAGEISRHAASPSPLPPAPSAPDATKVYEIVLPDAAALEGLETRFYEDFGLYIWRSSRLFLSVRCGPVGQDGRGGHGHNDQLSVELQVDGEDWAADPGTFLYTAAPELRDAYRSVRAHAAPRLGNGEPERLDLGLFRLSNEAHPTCHRADANGFHGTHRGYQEPVFRVVEFGAESIRIVDGIGAAGPGEDGLSEPVVVRSAEEMQKAFGLTIAFSPGYGLR